MLFYASATIRWYQRHYSLCFCVVCLCVGVSGILFLQYL